MIYFTCNNKSINNQSKIGITQGHVPREVCTFHATTSCRPAPMDSSSGMEEIKEREMHGAAAAA